MAVWRHSRRDALPCLVTLAQLALNLWIAATWSERSLVQLLLLWLPALFLSWYNPVVATHNFLHTPWFAPAWANRAYAALNSVNLGLPHALYRYHHLNHHRYENDRRGPDGRTRDRSSTFAHGRGSDHEPVVLYCALGLFRGGTAAAYRDVVRKGEGRQFWCEAAACALGLAGYASLSWQYLVGFFLPTFYLGWFLAHMENYYEHFGACPEGRSVNSVSYYGRIYNLFFCNEGYHQEHHLRPQWHWTRRPDLRDALPRGGRVVSKVPPVLGFLDRR
jgi:fatty acid desaturase